MAEDTYDDLVSDLVALGRGIDLPAPRAGLTTAVMDRLAAVPAPTPPRSAWTRPRRVALVVAAALFALLATPPVRAAVADWFGFGRVVVETGRPGPGTAPPPPAVTQDRSVTDAAAAVDFTVLVPEELGVPDGVEVSPDRRLVSMSWSSPEDGPEDGPEDSRVRLDQFDAEVDYSIVKRTPDVVYTSVDGSDALWFVRPHELVLLEPDGSRRAESARLAGHTLVWLTNDTTLRLEGDLSLERAIEIAESSVPVD